MCQKQLNKRNLIISQITNITALKKPEGRNTYTVLLICIIDYELLPGDQIFQCISMYTVFFNQTRFLLCFRDRRFVQLNRTHRIHKKMSDYNQSNSI